MTDTPHTPSDEQPCAHESWDVTGEHKTPAGWAKTRKCNECPTPLASIVEAEPHWGIQPADAVEPEPFARVMLRLADADDEITVEAESHGMNPAATAYGLRNVANEFDNRARAQGIEPIGTSAEEQPAPRPLCNAMHAAGRMAAEGFARGIAEAEARTAERQAAAPSDAFTEAAVSRSALLAGITAIEALPQDYECDPGRGDAVKVLRRLADHYTTNEQPAGLTWEARTEHAVRLYATTAIERDDARAEAAKLREQLLGGAELEQSTESAEDTARRFARRLAAVEQLCNGRPGYHTITVKALLTAMSVADDDQAEEQTSPLTAAEVEQGQADADHLATEHPDTVESLLAEIADDIPHRRAPQIAADYLARYTRLLAAEAHAHTSQRNNEMRTEGYRGRVAWTSGMREVARLLDARADTVAEAGR